MSDWGQGYERINLGTWRIPVGDFPGTDTSSITKLPQYLKLEYTNPYVNMRESFTGFFGGVLGVVVVWFCCAAVVVGFFYIQVT